MLWVIHIISLLVIYGLYSLYYGKSEIELEAMGWLHRILSGLFTCYGVGIFIYSFVHKRNKNWFQFILFLILGAIITLSAAWINTQMDLF
jgi:uncharacterized membrane protein